jgi:hypothetical protein
MITTELEDLSEFNLGDVIIDYDFVNYTITFPGVLENNTGLTVSKVHIDYSIDNGTIITNTIESVFPIDIILPTANKDKKLNYIITPFFENEDMPLTYVNKYKLEGSLIINSEFDNIKLTTMLAESGCSILHQDYRQYETLTLTNSIGEFIDNTLGTSQYPYQFYLEGTAQPIY